MIIFEYLRQIKLINDNILSFEIQLNDIECATQTFNKPGILSISSDRETTSIFSLRGYPLSAGITMNVLDGLMVVFNTAG